MAGNEHLGLSDRVLTSVALTLRSASTVQNGAAIDMQGWEGARFVIPHGTFGVNSTLDGLVQTAPDSGFNTVTNVTNSNLTQITNANGVAVIDVWRPTSRYIRLQLTPAVNAVLIGATVDQYRRAGILPPTQNAVQYVKVAQN